MRQRQVVGVVCLVVSLFVLSCQQKSPGVPVPCQEQTTLTPACFDALYAQYSPLLEAATHIAVGLYLTEYPQRAAPMYGLITDVHAQLSQTELSTLEHLEAMLLARVPWQQLEPGMAEGVRLMLRAVRAALQAFLEQAQVTAPPQVTLVVRDVLAWTARAALISCPPCVHRYVQEGQR
jgi:hypothetical protein